MDALIATPPTVTSLLVPPFFAPFDESALLCKGSPLSPPSPPLTVVVAAAAAEMDIFGFLVGLAFKLDASKSVASKMDTTGA